MAPVATSHSPASWIRFSGLLANCRNDKLCSINNIENTSKASEEKKKTKSRNPIVIVSTKNFSMGKKGLPFLMLSRLMLDVWLVQLEIERVREAYTEAE